MGIKNLLVKKEENKLKSIIYIDNLNNVKVEYKNFKNIIDSFDEEDIIKINKPTKKDFEWLQDIIIQNVLISEDQKKMLQSEFDEFISYELINRFTTLNLGFDLKNENELEEWRDILEESSDLILAIRREISDIVTFVMKNIVKNIQEFMELPSDFKEALFNENENKKLLEEIKQIKSDIESEKSEIDNIEGDLNV